MNGALSTFRLLTDDAAQALQRWPELGLVAIRDRPAGGFYLETTDRGLTLQHADTSDHDHGLCLDICADEILRRLDSGRRSPLARAMGLRRHPAPSVLDTTCGLGRDSATLAGLGCRVTALERHPVLFALLDDALSRAREHGPPWVAKWQALLYRDAQAWLDQVRPGCFDIIYIDPMFAAPRRKARPQKALAWLNELVGEDADAGALLALARERAGRQVVVKQHARGQPLALPDRQVQAKAVRFDIYLSNPGTSGPDAG